MTEGALADLTVLDLSRGLAGPFCAQILADQGANVIKVEDPDGDSSRNIAPYMPDDTLKAFGAYFQSVNRNKRSVVLNLKTAAARAALIKLVAKADVLIENYRAGVMERLGLAYEDLAKANPRLVYAAIRGYGDPRTGKSPYVDWPAFDITAQALGGIVAVTGPDADTPTRVGPSVGDMIPGLFATIGILSAVHEAKRSGRGQFVDVAMYDAILAICERAVYRYTYAGHVSVPEGNDHPLVRPFGIFPTRDGAVSIAGAHGRLWGELCEVMGRPDLPSDARFDAMERRLANSPALNAIIADWSRQFTKAELAAKLGGRVPFAPVNNASDVLADPHNAARGMFAEVEHPGSSRKAKIVASPIKMTRTPAAIRRRAPKLGEHTEEVLREAGLDEAAIAALCAARSR